MGPFNARLFTGGPCSERGFVLNRLRPRDAQDNSLGGNSRLTAQPRATLPKRSAALGAAFAAHSVSSETRALEISAGASRG